MQKKSCKTFDAMIMYYSQAICSNDKMSMNKSVIPSLRLIKEMGYVDIMPFTEVLSNNGFKPKDIATLILKFMEELRKDKFSVESIKIRVIKRGDNIDRNNILNRLVFEFESKFLEFLEKYDDLKESKMLILSSIKDQIEQGKKTNPFINAKGYSLNENEEHTLNENEEHPLNENEEHPLNENEEHPLKENDEYSLIYNENSLKDIIDISDFNDLPDTNSIYEDEYNIGELFNSDLM